MTINNLKHIFSDPLLKWFDMYGRKNLPWQIPKDPYRIWVSEIMLQQTQVQTVIPYFNRFMLQFPTINTLATASDDEVMSLWSGLGYYSRARNLQKCAKIIATDYQGLFPTDLNTLLTLPGIGPSTGGAILSQAFNQPTAILDGNVKRVLSRFFKIKTWPETSQVKQELWNAAHACMPQERCADYTQAIMDLGATCCKLRNPDCHNCPVQHKCLAFKNNEQHLYPTKKIKKVVPLQTVQFLVLNNEQNLIYLEKRPPSGLWGGLWCLPSANIDECPLSAIQSRYSLSGEQSESLIKFKHKFSHFHLEINAVKISIKTNTLASNVGEVAGQWFSQNQLDSLGLAKPISFILDTLYKNS